MSQVSLSHKSSQYRGKYSQFKKGLDHNNQMIRNNEFFSMDFTSMNAYHGSVSQKPQSRQVPLKKLKPITFRQLTLGNTHKGYYIKLKFILPVYRQSSIHGLCEDDIREQCYKISIFNFDLKGKPLNHYFNQGDTIYIKEPFFKVALDRTHIIRIDNPKEVVFAEDIQASHLSTKKIQSLTQENQIEEKYRNEGVQLMKSHKYIEAYVHYGQALDNTNNKQYQIKFMLNRAIVCIKLNLLKQYYENVQKVLKLDQDNVKAKYHLIKYYIYSGKFEEALAEQEKHKKIFDQASLKDLNRLFQIQKGFRQNKPDWFKAFMQKELSEFTAPFVKIQKVQFGFGVVTKEKIPAGTILFVENPLLSFQQIVQNNNKKDPLYSAWNRNQLAFSNSLDRLYLHSNEFKKKVHKLLINQVYQNNLQDLQKNNRIAKSLQNYTFESHPLTYYLNEKPLQQKIQPSHFGLYLHGSMMNHACDNNCERLFIGETMIVYTLIEVQAGKQLFLTYKELENYKERHEILQSIWGIECKCLLCQDQLQQLTKREKMQCKSIKLQLWKLRRQIKLGKASIDALENFYNFENIPLLISLGKKQLAAKILRKLFPMKEAESIQVLSKFVN